MTLTDTRALLTVALGMLLMFNVGIRYEREVLFDEAGVVPATVSPDLTADGADVEMINPSMNIVPDLGAGNPEGSGWINPSLDISPPGGPSISPDGSGRLNPSFYVVPANGGPVPGTVLYGQ